jgi:hypothetical protein
MSHPMIVPFTTTATSGLGRGADALRYVMVHRHAVTVPTDVLHFAEKVGIRSIARREDESATVVDAVNRALDVIAATLRARAHLDAEAATVVNQQSADSADVAGGHAVRLIPPTPTRPPAGSAVMPRVDADAAFTF